MERIQGWTSDQVTFRYPDNQGRTVANVNLAWNAKKHNKIFNIGEGSEWFNEVKTHLFKKAVELRMEPISQNKDNYFLMGSLKKWLLEWRME